MFEQIKSIGNQYSEMVKKMDKENNIVLVLEKVPSDYAGILATMEEGKSDALTMEDLEEAMAM
eukprot:11484705-Ditylum_brightwellii.AAC.2